MRAALTIAWVSEEGKVVTVLFTDLVGFTSRSERMDVEDVRGTLAPYHALLREQLEHYGGTVEKFIGDAVMALFPELGSGVLGETTGSEEPATEDGVDPDGGDNADATADGGPDLPDDIEADLKDVGTPQLFAGRDNDDH